MWVLHHMSIVHSVAQLAKYKFREILLIAFVYLYSYPELQ